MLKARKKKDLMGTGNVVRVSRNGRDYDIPVDSDGNVPLWAMASRLQEFGTAGDIDSDAPIVLPPRCSPRDIIDWWVDPNGAYDIEGIDTKNPEIYDVSSIESPTHRKAQRRIAVVTPDPEEQARIRRVLSESFTASELCAMSEQGSFVIRTLPDCGDATGCYLRRQDGVEVPLVMIEEGCTPDGIVHEVVHHARAADPGREGVLRTSYPIDQNGKTDLKLFNRLSKNLRKKILREEERQTVAETVVRTHTDPMQSGYYDTVGGKRSRDAYIDDRRVLTNTPMEIPESMIPRLVGEKAKRAVTKGYDYTNIAKAEILSRNTRREDR